MNGATCLFFTPMKIDENNTVIIADVRFVDVFDVVVSTAAPAISRMRIG